MIRRLYLVLLGLCVLQAASGFAGIVQTKPNNHGQRLGMTAEEGNKRKGFLKSIREKLGRRFKRTDVAIDTDFSLQNEQEQIEKQERVKPKPSLPKGDKLAQKYAAIDDVGERAYQIILDLGLLQENKS